MLRAEKASAIPPVILSGQPCAGLRQRPRMPTEPDRGQQIERVDVSEPASISMGIAERYASAVYELVKDDNGVGALEADIASLTDAMAESGDFNALIGSPIYTRDEQQSAIAALASKMGLSGTMTNTLALMASKRRLFVLPQLVRALKALIAEDKNEVEAEVVSAKTLTQTQRDKLAKTLTAQMGKDVTINATVDESLIGGLIVKVGSKMIDTSIRSKLAQLQNAMKEVG